MTTRELLMEALRNPRMALLGAREFRLDATTHADDIYAYDAGRELAHRVTLRRFETF